MSVLIKGMEMPKSCYVCQLMVTVEYEDICSQTGEYVCQYDRADDCPLIEVPDHGRLVDADVLSAKCDDPNWCVWLSDIDDAPTVIPADNGGAE